MGWQPLLFLQPVLQVDRIQLIHQPLTTAMKNLTEVGALPGGATRKKGQLEMKMLYHSHWYTRRQKVKEVKFLFIRDGNIVQSISHLKPEEERERGGEKII